MDVSSVGDFFESLPNCGRSAQFRDFTATISQQEYDDLFKGLTAVSMGRPA